MHIGFDWGGTKIEAIALAPDGRLLWRKRVPTPRDDYDACIRVAVEMVRQIEEETGTGGTVGFGTPGAISPVSGLIKNANSTWLNGRPLDRDLAEALGRPVRIENDANCLAVSEAVDGAGARKRVVWAVILGTGAGSGLAIDGRALSGLNRIAGEWGHNPLPWPNDDERPGPACYCGKSGCLETYISGTGLANEHRRRTGEALIGEAVVGAMREGDPAARASFEITLDRLARGFAHVVNIVDPDVIVLGGGLSKIEELYTELPARMAPYLFSDACLTPVLEPHHGDSSGARGAAWLWRE